MKPRSLAGWIALPVPCQRRRPRWASVPISSRSGTNGAGEELAEGIVDARTVTVFCDGMSYVVADACLGMADTTGCSYGTCP